MPSSPAISRPTRGIQQPLFALPSPARPSALAEPKGVVYTKRWVVELLLDLAGYRPEINLVDAIAVEPAAGDGAFLGPLIERLALSCLRQDRPLSACAGSLVAYEVDEASADQARALAIGSLVKCGAPPAVAQDLARKWVKCGDYLLEALHLEANFVIGNPPYIRSEEIPEHTAALYRSAYATMRGRADLYIAFFEAALESLRPDGVCAFICADRWMRNQYGAELRQLVTSAFSVETVLEMHHAGAFDDEVDAYPAITVIRRAAQGATVVASAGSEVELLSGEALSQALIEAHSKRFSSLPGLRTARVEQWFRGTDPWPCHSPEQLALLRRLEQRFDHLETYAKVGIGVASGNDSVYVTRDPDLVEPSRLLPLAIAKDIVSGRMEWSGHYLVDPWDNSGLVALNSYPRLRAYFERH